MSVLGLSVRNESSHFETCILDITDEGCPLLLYESGKKMDFFLLTLWHLNYMLGVICSRPEFRGCRAAIIVEHWYIEHHTICYKYIMFGTIGLKINVAAVLCVI
jgi:hypothetical protein